MRVNNLSILLLILTTIVSCNKKLENKYLTEQWAISIHNTPGHQKKYSKQQELKQKFRKIYLEANRLQTIDCEKAILKYEEALDIYSDGDIYYNYGICFSKLKRFEEAILAYKNSIVLSYKKSYFSYYNIACAYSLLHKSDNSYEYLLKAVNSGYYAISYILKDPDLKYLRSLKEWNSWYEKYKNRYLELEPSNKEVRELVPTFGFNIYMFCSNTVKLCYYHRDNETNNCKLGTWEKRKNLIYLHFTKEKGREGIGKPIDIATADPVYKKYSEYEKAIEEKKTIDWSHVLNDINDNDSYDRGVYIKKNKKW